MKEKYAIKYFAYVRKSSEGQERQALSIPAQKEKLLQSFPDLDIEFIEEEKSAFKPYNRAHLTQMLERIDRGERTGLIAYHPDRLSRNEIDASSITYRIRNGAIADLKFATYYFENNPEGIWMLQMALAQSQYDSAKKGRDVKRGLEMKAKMGWRPSGAPIGYRNTPLKEKGFKTIEKDPERFHLVRRMWDLMITGQYTVAEVWKMSKEWGLTTVPHRTIGGKTLTRSYVYKNIFQNPFYYGYFPYKEKETGAIVWQKGQHEPMIGEWEYNLVQQNIGRTNAPRPKTQKDMAFTGSLMRCAVCDSSITAEAKVKRQKNGNVHHYVYYHCTRKKDPNCTEKSIELKQLTSQVHKILEGVTISERFKSWAIKNLHEIRKVEAEDQSKILKRKHSELELVNEQLSGLLTRFSSPQNANGELISNEEYQALKNRLLGRKNGLEAELVAQGKEKEQWLELSEKTFNFACYARIWFEKGDKKTKRAILACLGSNLVLKDQKININLHPFFLSILENKKSLISEDSRDRTSESGSPKRRKGTFVPSRPTGLAWWSFFRTEDLLRQIATPAFFKEESHVLMS